MTQFRIDVVVNPRRGVAGTREIERGLTRVEQRANRVQLAIQRAIAFVGIGFAIRQVTEFADSFTNLQNRLRVVTDGTRQLTDTTEELLQVANDTRSAFESTAELYARLALATRDLAVEGANFADITRSINQAIILSGASAKEANNGLIQLSQGLASGRLTGDELRSTLEQLPVVADVIAQELGVTRGELRALGAEGRITSEVIIRAFQNAEDQLQDAFAETVPTLSQSFVVLRNNVIAFIGRINEGTGVLRGFGAAVRFVGEELRTIVQTLTLVGVAAASIRLAPAIQGFFELQAAIRAGTAVRLGSIAAINAENAFLAEQAVANTAAAAAELRRIDAVITQIRVESLSNAIKKGGNALLFEKAVVTRQLTAIEAQRTAALATLVAAEEAQAAASLRASRNVTVFSQAADRARASVIALGRAIAANPIGILFVALASITAGLVIFRNEIRLTEEGVGTLGDLFAEFFEQLGIALSVIGDAFRNAFGPLIDSVREALGIVEVEFADLILVPALFVDRTIGLFLGLARVIPTTFANLPRAIGDVFIRIVNAAIDALEFIPDVLIGTIRTVGNAIRVFVNGQITAIQLLVESARQAASGNLSSARDFAQQAARISENAFTTATSNFGGNLINNIADELEDDLVPRLQNPFEGGFRDLGIAALNAFADGASFSGVRDFVQGLLDGAERRGQDRAREEALAAEAEASERAAQADRERAEALQEILLPLQQERQLLTESLALGQREADIRAQLRDITADLAEEGIRLNFVQSLVVDSLVRSNAAARENLQTAQSLQTEQDRLAERTRLVNQAFSDGVITADQYALAIRQIELDSAEAGTSIADGITTGINRIKEELEDLASTVDRILVDGFNGALNSLGTAFQETFSFIANNLEDGETSWVEYRDAIKETFRSAIDSILADLARLLAQRALLAIIGGPAGGAGAGAGGVIGALAGATPAQDGSTAAMANKPFLVGEQGPELFTPGQTGSITPTDQTIEALRGGAGNNSSTVVVQAAPPPVNVNTIVVDDPSKIPTGIESPDGRQAIRNVIREERSGIKRDLGA